MDCLAEIRTSTIDGLSSRHVISAVGTSILRIARESAADGNGARIDRVAALEASWGLRERTISAFTGICLQPEPPEGPS
jgi:hypothetical protein